MLIHVGLHKTGTTYLQQHVFPSAALGFRLISDHKEIIHKVVLCNPFAVSADQLRDLFGPRIDAARRESLTPVISCERLSGSPASGGCWWADGTERLMAAFPDAKIVVTIREQASIIASIYKHLVRNWLSASVEQFLDQEPIGRGFNPLCRLEYYEFHWMIQYCIDLVGSADRVHVLPFEWLRESPSKFVQPIVQADKVVEAEVPREVVNRGFSALGCSVQRRVNRVFVPQHYVGRRGRMGRALKSLCWHINNRLPDRLARSSDRRLRDRIRHIRGSRYGRSNEETSRMMGLDLKSLGYVV